MSNQPKATKRRRRAIDLLADCQQQLAAEREGKITQPKPETGGEWTAGRVKSLLGSTDGVEGLVYEINAALAAERDEHAKALLAKQTRIEIFQQQLAALEGVLAEDTGKAALAAAIKESYEKGRKDEQDQSSTLR